MCFQNASMLLSEMHFNALKKKTIDIWYCDLKIVMRCLENYEWSPAVERADRVRSEGSRIRGGGRGVGGGRRRRGIGQKWEGGGNFARANLLMAFLILSSTIIFLIKSTYRLIYLFTYKTMRHFYSTTTEFPIHLHAIINSELQIRRVKA